MVGATLLLLSFLDSLKYALSLDKRSLAVFRVVLGLTTIGDLVDRITDLKAHYTEEGVFLRSDMLLHHANQYHLVPHWMNGTWNFAFFMFCVHFVVAIMMTVGYRTRLSTFCTWLLTVSLHSAAPYVGHSGDVYHRILLFWAFFLPISDMWSLDALTKQWKSPPSHKKRNHLCFSAATIGLLAHCILVYTISVYHKTGPEWLVDRTAVFYALNLDYFQQPVGKLFLSLPDWTLKALCIATLIWEKYGPLAFIMPWKTDYWRALGCLGFWALHGGFGICLRLGLFYFITTAYFFAFIPTMFWDKWLLPYLRKKERLGFKVFYNPANSFSKGVAFFLRFFMIDDTMFLSFVESDQMDVEVYPHRKESIPPNHSDTWLVVKHPNGNLFYDMEALIVCLRASPLLWIFGNVITLLPKKFFNYLEKCAHTATMIAPPSQMYPRKTSKSPNHIRSNYKNSKKRFSFYVNVIVQIFLLYVVYLMVCWNLSNIGLTSWTPDENVKWVVWLTRSDQQWNMFSPSPPSSSWYYWIDGELINQKRVELFKNGAIFTWEYNYDMDDNPPEPFHISFKNHRWYKFFENGFNQDNNHMRLTFGKYLCREFNARHDFEEHVWKFDIWLITRKVELTGEKVRTDKQRLWTHKCFEEKPLLNIIEG
eukprot:TRINITY_DN4210_c0_g1_i1.p1 TRINITY_DN4210_c0_g1~~TRINITY_DN4210_c0_g1_i1.p1  ORF type:complete len:661 (-),score=94.69 TRINITY_DN4210_c0_g1_i1:43-1989(-)